MKELSNLPMISEDAFEEAPWYRHGLRFECTGCGKCCTGSPGYVWITEEEIQEIADFLKISKEKMMRSFVRQKDGRFSLTEKSKENYACVFLKDNKCQIYPVRPKQCQTFPWWVQNLKGPGAWRQAAKECEGIRHDAPLVSYEEIQKNLS